MHSKISSIAIGLLLICSNAFAWEGFFELWDKLSDIDSTTQETVNWADIKALEKEEADEKNSINWADTQLLQ